jgi:AGCS family alanine or glycine:cation symporter
MAILYVGAGLVVLAVNVTAIPDAFRQIFEGAFSPEGVAGGFVGVLIQGFRRATFSNEAGVGSAAIAHSAVKTREPVTEGYVALLEPFIDTVVICTMTALVIITTVYQPGAGAGEVSGIELTTRAFASTVSWAPIPLSVAAVLFAISTMIAWSYYGLTAFTYLVGYRTLAVVGFKAFFLVFVVLGSAVNLGALIDLSDALVFIVAIPNLLGLYLLAPVVRREIAAHRAYVRDLVDERAVPDVR